MLRWLKFNAVGILGAGVQLGVLALLTRPGSPLELHYLIATALAVETALLHNYLWHVCWTWRDRTPEQLRGSLLRFHLANGVISLISNLVWMQLLTGWMGIAPVPANLIAITVTSVANFLLGDRWVFHSADRCNARL